jgi:rubrerythrin
LQRSFQDIANEEKVHIGEFQKLLDMLAEDEEEFIQEGKDEVVEIQEEMDSKVAKVAKSIVAGLWDETPLDRKWSSVFKIMEKNRYYTYQALARALKKIGIVLPDEADKALIMAKKQLKTDEERIKRMLGDFGYNGGILREDTYKKWEKEDLYELGRGHDESWFSDMRAWKVQEAAERIQQIDAIIDLLKTGKKSVMRYHYRYGSIK